MHYVNSHFVGQTTWTEIKSINIYPYWREVPTRPAGRHHSGRALQ